MPTYVRESWGRRLRWFAAEFLVVVTGILVALALDALFQRVRDQHAEAVYLSLLGEDLSARIRALQESEDFENRQLADGLLAYREISRGSRAEVAAASGALQRLTVRRTLRLQEATYQDLISTGNLPLLRNRELRGHVVDYFENTQRQLQVIDRNNAFFVDDIYTRAVTASGLILPRATMGNLPSFVPLDSTLASALRGGYIGEPDRLWQLPPGAPEWAQLKAVLLSRIRASAIARRLLSDVLRDTEQLKREIDTERKVQG